MQIIKEQVPWWHGYETLLITDTPRKPSIEEVTNLLDWCSDNLRSMYAPSPFREFDIFPPWRHFPHERWDICTELLNYSLQNLDFVDLGGNAGYYVFLAKASSAKRATLVDIDQVVTEFAKRQSELYGMDIEVFNERMEQIALSHYDVGFCFSALAYIGNLPVVEETLEYWSQHIDVLFVEMGDGGSYLEETSDPNEQYDLFASTCWKPTFVDNVYSSHTDTYRPIWKLEAKRIVNLLYPFIPIRHEDSTQSRCYRDGNGLVLKLMEQGSKENIEEEFLAQQKAFAVAPERVAEPITLGQNYILMKDLGETEPITDFVAFKTSAEKLLNIFQTANVVHGDMDPPNFIVQDNELKIIDFGWARVGSLEEDRKRMQISLKALKP